MLLYSLPQTQAPHPLTGLQLSFLVNGIAAPCLLLFYTLPLRLHRWMLARRARKKNPCIAFPEASVAAAVAAVAAARSGRPQGRARHKSATEGMQLGGSATAGLGAPVGEGAAAVAAEPVGPAGPSSLRPLRVRAQQPPAGMGHSMPTTPLFEAPGGTPTAAAGFPGSEPAGRPPHLSLLEDVAAVLSPRAPKGPPALFGATLQPDSPTVATAGRAELDVEQGPSWGEEEGLLLLASPRALRLGAGSLRRRTLLRRPSLIEDTATSHPELQDLVRVRLEVRSPRARVTSPRVAPPFPQETSPRGGPSFPQMQSPRGAPPFPPVAPDEPLSPAGSPPAPWSPHTPGGNRDGRAGLRRSTDLEEPLLARWGSAPLSFLGRQSVEPSTPQQGQRMQRGQGAAAAGLPAPAAAAAGAAAGASAETEEEAFARLKIEYGEEHHWLTPYVVASLSAAALAVLALALIFSVRFTQAHWCQLVRLVARWVEL